MNRLIDNKKETVLPKSSSDKELANRFQTYFKEKIEKIRASFTNQPETAKPTTEIVENLSEFKPTDFDEIKSIVQSYGIKCSPEDPVPLDLLAEMLTHSYHIGLTLLTYP